MKPELRKCGAELGDGKKCEEMALVLGVHYKYAMRPAVEVPAMHVMTEAHYYIRCPKCGERTQIEKAS